MILFQVDLLEQRREEAFILLGITAGLFLAALILIAILILRRKNRQGEEASLEFSPEIPKIDSKKLHKKSKETRPKKESPIKKKAADPVVPKAEETPKKKETPEDFMPGNSKTTAKKPIPSAAPIEAKSEPLKEANAKPPQKAPDSSNPKRPEENIKKGDQAEVKQPIAPIAKEPEVGKQAKTSVSQENPAPVLSKDQVAKNVADAIGRGNSKEENMARVQAYLEELKSKGAAANTPVPPKENAKSAKEKENSKKEEQSKAEEQDKEGLQVGPDPEMPSGALNPPFVPNPTLPETPTAETIRLEFEKSEDRSTRLGENEPPEIPEDSKEPTLGAAADKEQSNQQDPPSIAKTESKSAPTKESSPEPSVGIQEKGTDLEQAQTPLPPVQTPTTTITELEGPSVSVSEKEEEPAPEPEEKAKKSSKDKKMPLEGYRSFADWLRQTKG